MLTSAQNDFRFAGSIFKCIFKSDFFLYFFIRISLGLVSDGPSQVTIGQHQIRKWLVVQRAISYCLDLWWPRLQTQECAKRPHWVNADAFMFQFTHTVWCYIINNAMYQTLPRIWRPCILKHNSDLSITSQYQTHYCSKDPCLYCCDLPYIWNHKCEYIHQV